MPIELRCPNPSCGTRSTAPDAYAGKPVRCSQCKTKFRVPAPGETVDPSHTPGVKSPAGPAPKPKPAHTEAPLTRLGRFEVKKRLGGGGFGEVFLANDPQLQRDVALKVPRPGVLDNERLIERFLVEAKAAAGLNHPHIVPVYDAGEEAGRHFIASAFIPGQSLAETIDEGGVDFQRAARIVRALADALGYAHDEGIVHRDVKPPNVMMDEHDEPHLMDFGLAHRHEAEQKLTRDGAIMGTPSYMSPEQAQGQSGKPLPASDQYSLGVLLYQLLTGKTPYNGPTAIVILYNVIHEQAPPPRQHRPEIPAELETICLKAMAREPENRYPSCHEMAADLRRWQEGEPIQARRMSVPERMLRWVKRHPRQVCLGSVTVLCLLLVSQIAASKGRELDATRASTDTLLAEARASAATARERAEEAKGRARAADEQLQGASTARANAALRRQEAERARKEQETETAAFEASEKEARDEEHRVRQFANATQLEVAERRLDRKDFSAAREALNALRPQRDEDDRRDDRWRELWRQLGQQLPVYDDVYWERVRPTAVSADGSFVVLVQGKGSCDIREAASGKLLRRLVGPRTWIYSVAVSPDGKRVATGCAAGVVRLWDVATAREQLVLAGHAETVTSVAFHPSEPMLASASAEGAIKVWDSETGREQRQLGPVPSGVYALAYTPKGDRLVWGTGNGHIASRTGQGVETKPIRVHPSPIVSLAFYPDGDQFLTGHLDGSVGRGGLSRALAVPLTSFETKFARVAVAANGRYFGVTLNDGRGKVCNGLTGVLLQNFMDSENLVGLAFGPSRRQFLAVKGDGATQTLELPPIDRTLFKRTAQMSTPVAYSGDGKRLLSGGPGSTLNVWDAQTGKDVSTLRFNLHHYIQHAVFSPDGKQVALGMGANLYLFDAESGQQTRAIGCQTGALNSLAYSPDGKHLITACSDSTIKVWDVQTGMEAQALGHGSPVYSAALSADGKRVSAGGGDGKIKVWELQGGVAPLTFEGHKTIVRSVAFSPDGKRIVTGGNDGAVRVWDAKTGRELLSFSEHKTDWVSQVAFSPDGTRILSAGGSSNFRVLGEVKVWDASSGKVLQSFASASYVVHGAVFSPNGGQIAVADGDSVRLLDILDD